MVIIVVCVLQGMNIIEQLNPTEFTEYLRKYGNTICGRHPIGVLLNVRTLLTKMQFKLYVYLNLLITILTPNLLQAVKHLPDNERKNFQMRFLKYAQSSQCITNNDSSVSYAAASLVSLN